MNPKTKYACCYGSSGGRLDRPCPDTANKKTRKEAETYARKRGYTHTVAITGERAHGMEAV